MQARNDRYLFTRLSESIVIRILNLLLEVDGRILNVLLKAYNIIVKKLLEDSINRGWCTVSN